MSYKRIDVQFYSRDTLCRAWYYKPQFPRSSPAPCIVMAHGLGATRDAGLEPYAEKFAKTGFYCLLFDYRHFGASEGEPRQLMSVRRQLEDWFAAVSYARGIKGVDPSRIGLWGTSFSGGHVLVVAARDGNIAAISSQAPMMDGLGATVQTFRYAGIVTPFKLLACGIGDIFKRWTLQKPLYLPLVAKPGELAAMSSEDAEAGALAFAPPDFRNEISSGFMATLSTYRPVSHAAKVRCPALVQVSRTDSVAPCKAAVKTAYKMQGEVELQLYKYNHFDFYVGEAFERVSSEQLDFFARML